MAIAEWLTRCPLIAILRGVEPEEAVAIGAALERQGIAIVEVPLNRHGQWKASRCSHANLVSGC